MLPGYKTPTANQPKYACLYGRAETRTEAATHTQGRFLGRVGGRDVYTRYNEISANRVVRVRGADDI